MVEFGQFVGVAIVLVGIVVWFVVVRRYESNRKDGWVYMQFPLLF